MKGLARATVHTKQARGEGQHLGSGAAYSDVDRAQFIEEQEGEPQLRVYLREVKERS